MAAGLLLLSQLEVLAPLDDELLLSLALLALQTQCDLLGRLGLLVKDGLGLTTKTSLLVVVPPLALGEVGGLTSLVLIHLVNRVLPALLGLAESPPFLGNVHHLC